MFASVIGRQAVAAVRQSAVRQLHTTRAARGDPRVAIAGVTGAVGKEFLRVLEERNFPLSSLKVLASSRSAGSKVEFKGESLVVEELTEDSFHDVDIALFSAGGSQSKKFGPAAVKSNCVVVDNSSAFRMTEGVPLVVPEVNPEAIAQHSGIIANPNCSTIIMNVAVYPLYKHNKVTRAVVSTYQAASGAGAAAMDELEAQAADWVAGRPLTTKIWPRQYIFNLFSHNADIDLSNGYNEEEIKMIRETRKIFGDDDIKVSVTCIRVPVLRAHCEAINLTFENPITESEARAILADAPGVTILDNRAENRFPEPNDASGVDDVIVGRIREDLGQDKGKGLEMFVAGDQLLKGAALNAVQIAELI